MSLLKWAFIGLLVLPAAELAGLLLAAMIVGWLWAALAFVGTSVLGIVLLKRSGSHELARLARALRTDGMRALRLDSPGASTLLGAILLVLPGFITDILGGALFIPQFRRWAASALAKAADRASRTSRHQGGDHIIDLEPSEWHQIADQKHPGGRQRARRKSKSEMKGFF